MINGNGARSYRVLRNDHVRQYTVVCIVFSVLFLLFTHNVGAATIRFAKPSRMEEPLQPSSGSDRNSLGAPTMSMPTIPPHAVIKKITPNPATVGETIWFEGSGTASNGYITHYLWNSCKDGNLSTSALFSRSDLTPGIHIITFKVKDNQDEWSQPVATTLVVNIPPVAYAGEEPYFGWVNESILFDGSGSTDVDGTIDVYHWDFGDGTTKTGEKTQHTYKHAGVYTVHLMVKDDYGATNTVTTTATIVGNPPCAHAGGPYFGYMNESLLFNGSQSTDIDGTIVSYVWDFGDEIGGIGKTPIHTYAENGTYLATLTVTDSDGETDTDTAYVYILKPNSPPDKPDVTVSASETDEGEYSLRARATDPDNNSVRYIIGWGDQTNTTTPYFPHGTHITATHTWAAPGLYFILVYAEDEYNALSEPTEITVLIESSTDNDPTSERIGTAFYTRPGENPSSVTEQEKNAVSLIVLALLVLIVIAGIIIFFYHKKDEV